MNGDGTAQTRLTNPDDWAFDPTWSPDGTRMAFVAGYVLTDLFVMNSDGSGRQQLTATSDPEYQPSWSPDGSKIAFSTYRNGNWDIFVVNADGSGESRLTTDEAQEGRPDWSPDGSKIAFDSYRSGSLDVWVMNADGSDVTRLTYGTYDYSYFPVWSPDGTKIAFTYDDGTGTGNKEIYSMNPDGTGRYRVTDTQEPNLLPDWQPIGGGPTMTPRPVAVGGRLGLLDSKSYEDQSSSSARHAQPRVVVVALPALLISLTLFAYVTRRHTRCRL
jgi:TolB protein